MADAGFMTSMPGVLPANGVRSEPLSKASGRTDADKGVPGA